MPTHSGNVDVRTPNYGLVQLSGKVTFSDTPSAGTASTDAVGFDVVRAGTGIYTLTTDDKWPSLKAVHCTYDTQGTAADVQMQTNGDLTSNNALTLLNVVAGSAADPTDGDSVWITLWLKNTSITP